MEGLKKSVRMGRGMTEARQRQRKGREEEAMSGTRGRGKQVLWGRWRIGGRGGDEDERLVGMEDMRIGGSVEKEWDEGSEGEQKKDGRRMGEGLRSKSGRGVNRFLRTFFSSQIFYLNS